MLKKEILDKEIKIKRLSALVDKLNEASRVYYSGKDEIMDNNSYDNLYDELLSLEKELGIVMSSSPSVNVGYEVLSNLPKENHLNKMLSLDKTKDVQQLKNFLGKNEGLLSWKLDGLTVVLTYENGELTKAVTRGNGEVGEVITANAKTFLNLPIKISYKGNITVRGEAVISYADFEEINKKIENIDEKYKNPRNLCSGSVRQLDSRITKKRRVRFYGFDLVSQDEQWYNKSGVKDSNSMKSRMDWLVSQGFETVENIKVSEENLKETVEDWEKRINENQFPSDGLVLVLDDIKYGKSLGTTAKFPRNAMAFKWTDQEAETTLKYIEWSPSRTGLINPIAVFDSVELEGTSVSRASLHNISIMKELELGIGDRITVYKANMIIPQIKNNLTRSSKVKIPEICPVCLNSVSLKNDNEVEVLVCENPKCMAKRIKSITHFISRNAMNIDGMSEATVEKFIENGIIKNFGDIFRLEEHKDKIISMEGFGEKSFENLLESVDKAKKTKVSRLLYALGVSNIGVANAKVIADFFENDWELIEKTTEEELENIDGIGSVMAKGFVDFFKDEDNIRNIQDILSLITFEKIDKKIEAQILKGLTFVITGTLEQFTNRDDAKLQIENFGGKVATSVSKNTNFLVNNDIESNSSKNKKAKDLGIPIINEVELLSMLKQGEK